MATEASKTNALRSPEFFAKYLSGSVIDIGQGMTLLFLMQRF